MLNLTNTDTYSVPFSHIIIRDFLDAETLDQVSESLFNQQFSEKKADLFHFFQTNDLKPVIPDFIQQLFEKLAPFLEETFHVPLSRKTIDIQGSIYSDGHHLLCHDDQLDSRAVAFMLYLTDIDAGGQLRLYAQKDNIPNPNSYKDIAPQENTLVCFLVGEKSFHEVKEVIADQQRVTIGGWFHHAQ